MYSSQDFDSEYRQLEYYISLKQSRVLLLFQKDLKFVKNVLIVGGGKIAYYLAKLFYHIHYHVTKKYHFFVQLLDDICLKAV